MGIQMKAQMKEKGTSIVTSFSGHPTSRQSAPGNFMVTRLKVRYTFRVLLVSSQGNCLESPNIKTSSDMVGLLVFMLKISTALLWTHLLRVLAAHQLLCT